MSFGLETIRINILMICQPIILLDQSISNQPILQFLRVV